MRNLGLVPKRAVRSLNGLKFGISAKDHTVHLVISAPNSSRRPGELVSMIVCPPNLGKSSFTHNEPQYSAEHHHHSHAEIVFLHACRLSLCAVTLGCLPRVRGAVQTSLRLTLSTAPSPQMASGVFLNRILLSNQPKKLFINSRFIFLVL